MPYVIEVTGVGVVSYKRRKLELAFGIRIRGGGDMPDL